MSTEKQILANRLNGLKGGVKTPAGKAVSRLNAVSHGIFTQDTLIQGEDAAKLAELRDRCLAEFQPVGEMETILVERIVSSTWRLKRVLACEKTYIRRILPESLTREGLITGIDYRYSSWSNHSRYEVTIERQLYRAIHELERLQDLRRRITPHPEPSPGPDSASQI